MRPISPTIRKLPATLKQIASGLRHGSQASLQSMLELVLPAVCRLCGDGVDEGRDFCPSCQAQLSYSEPWMKTACKRCGFPRPQLPASQNAGVREHAEPDSAPVLSCVTCKQLKFQFDQVIALWAYQDRVRDAVVAAKYAHQAPLADALGRRLAACCSEAMHEDPADLMTYVPSHFTRRLARGGLGTAAISHSVAKLSRIPVHGLLRTTRRIAKQAWLDEAERADNVRGAFALKKSYAFARSPDIANRHILLVDDVLTTGATANEIACIFRKGGARRVSLAVVARALRRE